MLTLVHTVVVFIVNKCRFCDVQQSTLSRFCSFETILFHFVWCWCCCCCHFVWDEWQINAIKNKSICLFIICLSKHLFILYFKYDSSLMIIMMTMITLVLLVYECHITQMVIFAYFKRWKSRMWHFYCVFVLIAKSHQNQWRKFGMNLYRFLLLLCLSIIIFLVTVKQCREEGFQKWWMRWERQTQIGRKIDVKLKHNKQ